MDSGFTERQKTLIKIAFDVVVGVLATLVAVLPALIVFGVPADSIGILLAAVAGTTAAVTRLRMQFVKSGLLKATPKRKRRT